MPNTRTILVLPALPTPFNNKFILEPSIFDTKTIPTATTTTMSSNQSSISDRKPSKASDNSSLLSTSTTSSMTALLKSKFTPKSKTKTTKPEDELSPGEKQALRRQGRMDPRTLATIASLKSKAAKIFEDPAEDASDAYQARKATQFLRAGSL